MDRYPLVSALSRPLIVKHLVAAAKYHGASMVAHGCTGKGNDQVRFEVGIGALGPDLKVLAPVRDSGMTRDKAIAFAEEKGLPIDVTKKSPYSIDQNLWGRAVETGFLEDIWNGPVEDVYDYTADPSVPREADEVVITFERGAPVAIGRPRSSAKAMALSRVIPESRTGASTCRSGPRAPMPTSKRTWSLPLPVQPCETWVPPYCLAASARCLTISGRDSAETSG